METLKLFRQSDFAHVSTQALQDVRVLRESALTNESRVDTITFARCQNLQQGERTHQ